VVTSWGGLPTLGVMPRELPDEVLNLLGYQAGVLSWGQAQRAGMTGKQIDTAARSGRWQRLHAGVYAAFTGEPRRVTLLRAAVLRAGPKAVLSQHSAAELQGLLATPVPAIHVMVPTGSQVAPIHGVVLHYSSLVTRERHPALRPPQTRVEETVLDLAGSAASLDEALGWIFRACGSRRTTAGGSPPPWPGGPGCGGAPSSRPPSGWVRTGFTRCWSSATSTAWSGRTGCRSLPGSSR
jgi:hypothetical protein